MSVFQCAVCGCAENTALASQGFKPFAELFDWTGVEERRGKLLCSACGPTKYSDGTQSKFGKWHGRFERKYLPIGMFRTAQNGNLEHIETGSQDIMQHVLPNPELSPP